MTETAARPGITGELLYAEDNSGLERRVVAQAIAAPVVFLALFVLLALASSTAVRALLALPVVAAGIWAMVSVLGLIYNRPIGMRIDSAGIRIGGLRAWEKRQLSGRWPPRKPFHVGAQGRAVFTCPWEGQAQRRDSHLHGGQPGRGSAAPLSAYPRHMGVQVLPATGRWEDFASFMVPRKPGGGGCVCMAYRNSSLGMPGRIAHMRALCATALEGYPVDPGRERVDQTSGYVGTVPLFGAHGFSCVCQTAGRRGGKPRWLVRRELP